MRYYPIISAPPEPVAPKPLELRWAWRGGIWWARLICVLTGHSPTPFGYQEYRCRDCGTFATWRWL